ncbi:MAG: ABC transporter permease [Eggerthellaceae bacterium]|nr:ABC transporter permease [Eggerthellaceae bacterium]
MPLIIILGLAILFSLMFYPILQASPRNIPIAIVSLDEGMTTPAGETNVGQTLIDSVESGEGLSLLTGDDSSSDTSSSSLDLADALDWTILSSEEEAYEALDNNEYYAVLVIPEDFTQQQVLAMSGDEDAQSSLKIIINEGKNATISSSIESALTSAASSSGLNLEVEEVNTADVGGSAFGSTMMTQYMVMPLFMLSSMPAIMLCVLLWPRKELTTVKQRGQRLILQAIYILAMSLLNSLIVLAMSSLFGGLNLPLGELFLFFWFASAAVMFVVVGFGDIILPLGIVVLLICFAFGMSTAMLAAEMLPQFWVDWILPWVPQYQIAEGIRSIVYFGNGFFDSGGLVLLITGIIGICAMIVAMFLVPRHKKEVQDQTTAPTA